MTPAAVHRSVIVIQPSSGWAALNLRELWTYRDLLVILAGRDVKLRYKQTALGVIWVILQPLVASAIFAVIFGHFGGLPSDGRPYVLFVFAGLLPWNCFAGVLQRTGDSLIRDGALITKVYFPRLLLPLASTAAVLVDLVVALAFVSALMAAYHVPPTWRVMTIPVFLLLAALTATGVGLWLSALNVQYRDFAYALPFLVQVWMYASPVVYATSLIPERWRWLYSLNPVVGLIEGFRWALLGRGALTTEMAAVAVLVAGGVIVSGAVFFRHVERRFADAV